MGAPRNRDAPPWTGHQAAEDRWRSASFLKIRGRSSYGNFHDCSRRRTQRHSTHPLRIAMVLYKAWAPLDFQIRFVSLDTDSRREAGR